MQTISKGAKQMQIGVRFEHLPEKNLYLATKYFQHEQAVHCVSISTRKECMVGLSGIRMHMALNYLEKRYIKKLTGTK
jgi:hypothetical protein